MKGLVTLLLLAAMAGAAAAAAPPQLPRPTGRYPLGTAIASLRDTTRPDIATGRRGRTLRVQAWYPRADRGGRSVPYMPDAGVLEAMLERGYNRVEPEALRALAAVETHARLGAAPLEGDDPLPVLVLSHGHGMSRAHYTTLAEELASHGYLVVTVDHPYGGFMLGERRVTMLADDPDDVSDEGVLARRAGEWARDASFVLDALVNTRSELGRRFARRVEPRRAGMLGHSLGGAAALEACGADPRFQACVDMDGIPLGLVRERGPGAATMVLLSSPTYSDEELAARGRTRAQWEAMGRARAATFESIFAASPAVPGYLVEIRGTGHMSFSDAPFVLPSMVTRFGGTPIAAVRGHALMSAYLLGFFERHLRGGRSDLLDGAGERPAEVLFRAVNTPRLALRECTVLAGAVPARCGTFRVREDRTAPGGREIDLKVVVVPAERGTPAADPVFILPGGPGQEGTDLTMLVKRLGQVHQERDIVFVDQRGTGASNPLVCPGEDRGQAEFGPNDDPFWETCLRALEERADLRHYTTADAADDLDELRAALGYERVNLVGGSYGTRAAQVYLRRHPERVRSAVLWAVAPMGYDIPVEGGLAVQAAFERLLADCAADAACGAAFPRLGVQLDSLLTVLDARPERVRVPGADGDAREVTIDAGLFGQSLLMLLYDAGHMRRMPALLDRVARGDWTTFATIAAQVGEGKKSAPDGLYLSVVCSEDVPHLEQARLAEFSGRMGALLRTSAEDLLHRCARWPTARMGAAENTPFASAAPVLLLSGEGDPATPPRGAERALAYLSNARHIEVPATSHGPIFPGCVPELVAAFFDTPDPARVDARCVDALRWQPFAVPNPAGSAR